MISQQGFGAFAFIILTFYGPFPGQDCKWVLNLTQTQAVIQKAPSVLVIYAIPTTKSPPHYPLPSFV